MPQTSGGGWGVPLAVLIVSMFMSILDITVVNVAIPTIQNDFGVSTNDVQWVVTGYTLTLGVVMLASAWLRDRAGLSRVYHTALLMFAAGSALCGIAFSLKSLVIFRIIQAIPGGILPVVTISILFRIVPRERLGTALGLYGLGVVFAPAVGPVLGGYFVEYLSWRLIFFINVPIGVLGAIAAALVLPKMTGQSARRFDILGFITIASGLFALLLALQQGHSWGWDSSPIVALLTYCVLSLAVFVAIELRVTNPLLDIRIFRCWGYTHSMILIVLLYPVLYGVQFYISQFLQRVQGWDALQAGLTLLPQGLVTALLMPITGRIYDRIGHRWPAVIGLATMAAGVYLLHTITITTPRQHIMWLLVIQGVGMGLAMMPLMTGGMAVLPIARVNAGSVCSSVLQRVASALGLAMLTAILIPQAQHVPERTAPGQAFVGAIDDLFLIAAALAALGAVIALFLRSAPTAPTDSASARSSPSRGARSPEEILALLP